MKAPENPPVAQRIESVICAHAQQWTDHYAWLRADNWQEVIEDPTKLPTPIADYLKCENDYYARATAKLAPLQEEIVAEIRARMEDTFESIPVADGPYLYQYKFVENAEHTIRVRTDLNGDFEEVLLDVNAEATGFEYFDLGAMRHSPDHTKLLWSVDTKGSEFYTLHIRDIRTGLDKGYVIENTDMATWGDDQTIFYTRMNDSHRSNQVYKHIVDTNPENDVLVFSEDDERFYCCVESSHSKNYVFISVYTDDQDESWFIPVGDLNTAPTLVQARKDGLEYNVVCDQGDRFIIETTADGAVDWKLVEAPVNAASMEYWTDLTDYQSGRMIEQVVVFQDWVIWSELVDALPQIAYMDRQGTVKRILFEEEVYSLNLYSQLEYQTQTLVFDYSSPSTPKEYYAFNLLTAQRELIFRQVIPSGHDPKDYITRRFNVESHDGAQVPVTLLYHHDTPINGTAPALLCGYGANGASISARFGSARLSLVDRGFVYAIAHVRGGQDKGSGWYEDAKHERKPNSFHDFIAVGDALVAQRFCGEGKIVSLGGSSGGMLVAASMNMKPELFAGVIAAVPFVGVLDRLFDDTLPGTPIKWAQWGNPATSKSAFDVIRSYSPYENTEAIAYPPLFVTAAVSDTQVMYWEPAKWVAKIRSLKTDDNVVLLRTAMQSGHGGETGRFASIEDNAREFAFAIAVTTDQGLPVSRIRDVRRAEQWR